MSSPGRAHCRPATTAWRPNRSPPTPPAWPRSGPRPPPSRRPSPAASGGRPRLGVERARCPWRVGRNAAVFEAVVQAERLVLPELDQQRLQAKARPVRRPRYRSDQVFRGVLGHALFQREAALERPRLVGRPGAELAAALARGEIGVRLLGRRLRDAAFQPNL